ncbi:unnamed protein product, partial [Cyprideis torosa]
MLEENRIGFHGVFRSLIRSPSEDLTDSELQLARESTLLVGSPGGGSGRLRLSSHRIQGKEAKRPKCDSSIPLRFALCDRTCSSTRKNYVSLLNPFLGTRSSPNSWPSFIVSRNRERGKNRENQGGRVKIQMRSERKLHRDSHPSTALDKRRRSHVILPFGPALPFVIALVRPQVFETRFLHLLPRIIVYQSRVNSIARLRRLQNYSSVQTPPLCDHTSSSTSCLSAIPPSPSEDYHVLGIFCDHTSKSTSFRDAIPPSFSEDYRVPVPGQLYSEVEISGDIISPPLFALSNPIVSQGTSTFVGYQDLLLFCLIVAAAVKPGE